MLNLTINNKYIIKQKIGEGSTSKVFLVKELKSNKHFACKFFTHKKFYTNESNFLSNFSHKNTIKKFDEGEFKLKNKKLNYLILDYCEHGKLSNYIIFFGFGFGEKYGKFLFKNILETVNEIHNFGFAHCDLKLENILLDKFFNIKIVDFGFCCLLNNKIKNRFGTFIYAAPEIFNNKNYDGKKIDFFSLGIVLFLIVTGKIFFLMEERKKYFNFDCENYKKFVVNIEKECLNFSFEFRDLLFKMIKFNPNERLNYFDVINHEWMKNIEINKIEMENNFIFRDEIVRNKIEEIKILNEIENEKSFY
jgi:serine/threonine protein kinase